MAIAGIEFLPKKYSHRLNFIENNHLLEKSGHFAQDALSIEQEIISMAKCTDERYAAKEKDSWVWYAVYLLYDALLLEWTTHSLFAMAGLRIHIM